MNRSNLVLGLALMIALGAAIQSHLKISRLLSGDLSNTQASLRLKPATPTVTEIGGKEDLPLKSEQERQPVPTLNESSVDRLVEAPLREASGGQLFRILFEPGGLAYRKHLAAGEISQIEERFEQPYSEKSEGHFRAKDRAAIDRVGILKALDRNFRSRPNPAVSTRLANLYKTILLSPSEVWAVRRQALRNLTFLTRDVADRERLAWLSKIDSSLVAASAKTDREVLEASLGN